MGRGQRVSFLFLVHSLLYKVLEGRGSLGMLTPMKLAEQGSMARGITQAPTELDSPREHHQVKGLRTPRNYPQGPLRPGSAAVTLVSQMTAETV